MNSTITLTSLGHSCVLIESRSESGGLSRILLDPGNLTPPLEPIANLDAILITHSHPDHLDAEQIRRLQWGGPITVYGDSSTARILAEAAIEPTIIEPGLAHIAGTRVTVTQWVHEPIYAGIPLPVDFSYLIAESVFAPGDAFAIPDHPVDVLLLPTGAPWMKLAETIDYMRAVSPRFLLPVHDGGLARPHREMHRSLIEKFSPAQTTVLRAELGEQIGITTGR